MQAHWRDIPGFVAPAYTIVAFTGRQNGLYGPTSAVTHWGTLAAKVPDGDRGSWDTVAVATEDPVVREPVWAAALAAEVVAGEVVEGEVEAIVPVLAMAKVAELDEDAATQANNQSIGQGDRRL